VSSAVSALSNPSFSKTIPINVAPSSQVDSVFGTGNSYLIWSSDNSSASAGADSSANGASVSLYCVDCGIQGSTTVGGQLAYTLRES